MINGTREMDLGSGLDLERANAMLHDGVLSELKDQILICLLKRLANEQGRVSLSAVDLDASGRYVIDFRWENGHFDFIVAKRD